MYLDKGASRARLREAQTARDNQAEVRRALSSGRVSRREWSKWGIFTTAGTLAMTRGRSP